MGDHMPACDSVNARKAPTANNGISRSVTPPKTTSRTVDRKVSTPDPFRRRDAVRPVREGVRRYRRATLKQGKSANAVFAERASTSRMEAIAA